MQEEEKITATTQMNHKCHDDCTELRRVYDMWEAMDFRNTFRRIVMFGWYVLTVVKEYLCP